MGSNELRPLFDAFVICGLHPGEPLKTIYGDAGFQGSDSTYQPSIVDMITSQRPDGKPVKLPPQFAMVGYQRSACMQLPWTAMLGGKLSSLQARRPAPCLPHAL